MSPELLFWLGFAVKPRTAIRIKSKHSVGNPGRTTSGVTIRVLEASK